MDAFMGYFIAGSKKKSLSEGTPREKRKSHEKGCSTSQEGCGKNQSHL
jgi:hypothetical protein